MEKSLFFEIANSRTCEKSNNFQPKHSSWDNRILVIRFYLPWKKNGVKGTLYLTQKIVNDVYLSKFDKYWNILLACLDCICSTILIFAWYLILNQGWIEISFSPSNLIHMFLFRDDVIWNQRLIEISFLLLSTWDFLCTSIS